ncbi:TnsA-like heteromeric transposase endonuclease subunit [Micropruina glycogenica]|uniref:TnsA-like heteromeric transposase endonuclease subunit n=1 Tax=Micropruina glycogenica TaxID=75385 RepID=A0A2N9JGI0_9ACTN|nr:TnsA-like heteromeric transposase endonuclease subunit [Micropruina glycogenica]SPD86700.1 conserved protein of unknown function [Micropruina glycogenica]
MSGGTLGNTEFRFLAAPDRWELTSLANARAQDVVRGLPVRDFPSYRGQRNYPGLLWMATTRSLVGYESLLERDRLWLADFDPTVSWVLSQPFWVSGRDGSVLRRHVPDCLLETTGGYVVVDVKPAELLDDAVVAAVMSWTRRLCEAKGWSYEVWSGADPVLLRNIRFLAAVRRGHAADADTLGNIARIAQVGMTIAEVEDASGIEGTLARPASMSMLWAGRWVVDLSCPLTGASVLQDVA